MYLTRSVAALVIVAWASFTTAGHAEEPVYFADPMLKYAVEEALHKIDPNQTDMRELWYLYAQDSGIQSLVGLEYATNLMYLDLRGNNITDISPLAGLTNLEYLDLEYNQISDISQFARMTMLWQLRMLHGENSRKVRYFCCFLLVWLV